MWLYIRVSRYDRCSIDSFCIVCRVIISIGNSSSNSYVFCGILVISSKIVFLWLFIDIWVFLI